MSALTEPIVLTKSRAKSLDEVRNLNLWGSDLRDVSILRRIPNLEVLSLSVNKISSLSDFANCPRLTELYLRKNNVHDLNELRHLSGLRNLRILWLSENPCSLGDPQEYRLRVLSILPHLTKLDDQEVTSEELERAQMLALNSGRRRNNERDALAGLLNEKSPALSPVPAPQDDYSVHDFQTRMQQASRPQFPLQFANNNDRGDNSTILHNSNNLHRPSPAPNGLEAVATRQQAQPAGMAGISPVIGSHQEDIRGPVHHHNQFEYQQQHHANSNAPAPASTVASKYRASPPRASQNDHSHDLLAQGHNFSKNGRGYVGDDDHHSFSPQRSFEGNSFNQNFSDDERSGRAIHDHVDSTKATLSNGSSNQDKKRPLWIRDEEVKNSIRAAAMESTLTQDISLMIPKNMSNVLYAVLALVRELEPDGLLLAKAAIERQMALAGQ